MVTGDFLFEPRKGGNYDKDDDHLEHNGVDVVHWLGKHVVKVMD